MFKHLFSANRITLSRPTAYAVANNKLHLRLAEPEFSNYPLMRTINEATTLALEEKRILDEMAAVVKQNEIGDKPKDKDDKGAASATVATLWVVLCSLLSYKLF